MQIFSLDLAVWAMLTMAALAAVSDLRTGLISDRTVGLGALVGALAQLASADVASAGDLGWVVLRVLGGVLLCSLVPVALFVSGGLGGGDVKLFAAIGACLGPLAGMEVQFWAFIVTLVFVPIQLALRGRLRSTLRNSLTVLSNLFRPAARREVIDPSQLTSLRFAPSIFVAALLVVVGNGVQP